MVTPNSRTKFKFFRFTALAALILFVLTGMAQGASWWNKEWTIRKKVTVDLSSVGADAVGAAAVLIRLHDGDFQFGAAKDDGTDIRFVALDDKTLLPFHIEKYDGLLNEAFVWVKVPDLKAQTNFWLYYGNGGPKAVKADDAKATYDADTLLVYHFGEKGAPASDFSGNSNNAEKAGVTAEGSMIGGGLRLGGQNPVTIPPSDSLNSSGSGLTWSAWIKPTALAPNAILFARHDGARGLLIGADNGVPFVEVSTAGGAQRSPAGKPMDVNSWHHLAIVGDSAKITVYLDGENYGVLNAGLPALNGPSFIGGDAPAADGTAAAAGFVGEMDELEISKVARPESFIKFAALSQGGDKASKLLTLGADEQTGTSWLSGNSTFAVLINSLTLDGWVVIGLLIVMAVISWFVMISKARYLNAIARGNSLFLKEWRHVASDLTVLDHGDEDKARTLGGRVDKTGVKAMRNSSVYRIYHLGAEEIRHRLSGERGGKTKYLSAQSIHAIRAMLDGGLVRETQKLNSLMVLLTIAISGGPFLGLLGTVVGVMITFAAIAAAGDVNVNAIAPGIAAALLATVAGLAVAIPSLFGYNYLIARVKNATSDMHIFIDEFITKMAEFYCFRPD